MNTLTPLALSAKALKSAAGKYSLVKMTRVRSETNGTVSASNFSPDGIGGGEGGGAGGGGAAVVGVGAADGEGAGLASLLVEDETFDATGISSLVKYRKPPTPIATRQINVTATGHIQFGATAALMGFLTCGVA